MGFKNKRIVLTGAGRGLGAAFAVILADQGAEVVMTGRNVENLTALAESIRLRTGTRPETVALDMADAGAVTLFAKKLRDEGRPLDILINNAAQWLPGKMDEHDAYAISQTITGIVTGTLLLTRGLIPLLEKSGAGDIFNIISISGIANTPLHGQRFPGDHRLVDGAATVHDRPVDGDPLSRAHHKDIANGHRIDRDQCLHAIPQHGRVMRSEPHECPKRRVGRLLRPVLEVLAKTDEHQHRCTDIEEHVPLLRGDDDERAVDERY